MTELSTDAMAALLREAAGDDDDLHLDADAFRRPFTELGFDSLAMLEIAALVKREFGVTLTDDDMHAVRTPAELYASVRAMRTSA